MTTLKQFIKIEDSSSLPSSPRGFMMKPKQNPGITTLIRDLLVKSHSQTPKMKTLESKVRIETDFDQVMKQKKLDNETPKERCDRKERERKSINKSIRRNYSDVKLPNQAQQILPVAKVLSIPIHTPVNSTQQHYCNNNNQEDKKIFFENSVSNRLRKTMPFNTFSDFVTNPTMSVLPNNNNNNGYQSQVASPRYKPSSSIADKLFAIKQNRQSSLNSLIKKLSVHSAFKEQPRDNNNNSSKLLDRQKSFYGGGQLSSRNNNSSSKTRGCVEDDQQQSSVMLCRKMEAELLSDKYKEGQKFDRNCKKKGVFVQEDQKGIDFFIQQMNGSLPEETVTYIFKDYKMEEIYDPLYEDYKEISRKLQALTEAGLQMVFLETDKPPRLDKSLRVKINTKFWQQYQSNFREYFIHKVGAREQQVDMFFAKMTVLEGLGYIQVYKTMRDLIGTLSRIKEVEFMVVKRAFEPLFRDEKELLQEVQNDEFQYFLSCFLADQNKDTVNSIVSNYLMRNPLSWTQFAQLKMAVYEIFSHQFDRKHTGQFMQKMEELRMLMFPEYYTVYNSQLLAIVNQIISDEQTIYVDLKKLSKNEIWKMVEAPLTEMLRGSHNLETIVNAVKDDQDILELFVNYFKVNISKRVERPQWQQRNLDFQYFKVIQKCKLAHKPPIEYKNSILKYIRNQPEFEMCSEKVQKYLSDLLESSDQQSFSYYDLVSLHHVN